ncbi:MAG: M14 family zinc carboxypeptidase [Flavobacteriaceae bacterium]|nr:M14 family zinc carboxypeptidase [Flavobacteriaceae bacterium]
MKNLKLLLFFFLLINSITSQNYFLENHEPYNNSILSPEEFVGYEIGFQHTRHDQIVSYLTYLSSVSNNANLIEYGKTHEGRKLVMLCVSSKDNLEDIDSIKKEHLKYIDPDIEIKNDNTLPIVINLGYNVHGNEPSSSEAAMLTAYTLVASMNSKINNYRNNAIIFIDPTINPDGRDRHTQWANQFKSKNLISDGMDAEHNESWPRGRTNHYWFDLNRDWLLAINPESRGKLKWYHSWYPNVVTDFHEMGTNSNYFFEPMKSNASEKPLMPKENYEDLNSLFATYYSKNLDSIGSFYFTKEAFDGTYPGYGSSYPDLQGGLAILFEQASSRGHLQETDYGTISFAFTIRNQYVSSISTVQAAVENKRKLRDYQKKFFETSISDVTNDKIKAYRFGDVYDQNRTKAFIDKLLIHKVKTYKSGDKFIVPVKQSQSRMVKNIFESYDTYRDSVYYDASAWSISNFYNMKHEGVKSFKLGEEVISTDDLVNPSLVNKSEYAYIVDWDDYNSPAFINFLQEKDIIVYSAFKPFSIKNKSFNYGSVLIPVSKQEINSEELFKIITKAQTKFQVPVYNTSTGFSVKGIDLGSNNFKVLEPVKAAILIGDGINSYEAGEVWHLLDTRLDMKLVKIRINQFSRVNLNKYNSLTLVSGSYNLLDSVSKEKIKNWVKKGNTLITIANASKWVIKEKIVNESLTVLKDSSSLKEFKRLPYVEASEHIGKEKIGGTIFKTNIDLTHPIAFGYRDGQIPVYKNNNVFLKPSKNHYSNVSLYDKNPHIDGFVSKDNLNNFIKNSASIIVSKVGSGRVILFADNPNFRGSWYGTNKLFLNALFFGNQISVPNY